MHQDCWVVIIPFLQPIDILASLLTANSSLHNLIKHSCVVSLDGISNYNDLKISYHSHHENIEKMDHIPIYGNAKYFIRLHLLKLSLQLGNQDPEKGDLNAISKILNSSELKLFNFYRSVFTNFTIQPQKDSETIVYYVAGESGIGTSFFCEFIRYGERSKLGLRYGFESFHKKFTISNEIEWKQEIWIPDGSERFYSKRDVVQRYKKFDKNMHILPCFSMNYEKTLNTVGDWIANNRESLGILVGLSTNDFSLDCEEKKVNLNDAVKKAFKVGVSVFVECDDEHIFTPFWFIQLQYTYFASNNDNRNCSLM